MTTPLLPGPPMMVRPQRFRGLERPARLFVALVCCIAVLNLVSFAAELRIVEFADAIAAGEYTAQDATRTGEAIDAFALPLAIADLVLFLAAATTYIVWFRRARGNLPVLGAIELKPGTGWAVVAWLIPLVSLIMPKVIHNEIWRASDPDLPFPAQRSAWDSVRIPALHHVWWAAFILANVLETVGQRLTYADDLAALRTAALISAIADLLWIAAAALVVPIVLALTARQRARAVRSPWR